MLVPITFKSSLMLWKVPSIKSFSHIQKAFELHGKLWDFIDQYFESVLLFLWTSYHGLEEDACGSLC